ncbi:MAG TPA: hypothetical protein VFE86_11830 [Ilumatobacteraceae bacterium]|jgi:hypothetical protein|nr:hypothetical protein [Ilumatobacteraceae bacterium]
MPRTSKDEAELVVQSEVLTSRHAELGEYTVAFEEYHVDADGTPMFKGLPDDRCQCPHWGVVVRGELRLRYADREEIYRGGDAYVAYPGHVPVVTAATEVVEFSPTVGLAETLAVLAANMAATSELTS